MNPVMVVMQLELPGGALEKWRGLALDASRYDDWFEGDPLLGGTSPGRHATVGALFEALGERAAQPTSSYLELEPAAAVVLHACLGTDEDITGFTQDLATAGRLALEVGGKGDVLFVQAGSPVAPRLQLGKRKSKLDAIETEQAFAREAAAATLLAINDWLGMRQADPALSRAAFRAGEARFWLPVEPSAAETALQRAIAAVDDAAVAKVMARRGGKAAPVTTPTARPLALGELFATPAAFRAALAASEPTARITAPGLLAACDLATAGPLLLPLLSSPAGLLRLATARALGATRSPETLGAILAALQMGRVGHGLRTVLEKADPATLDRLLPTLLEGPLFRTGTYAALAPARRPPLPGPAEVAAAAEQLLRADIVCGLLAERGLKAALPLLERLFLDPAVEAIPLRRHLIRPLLALGGKKAEKTHGEQMQAFSLNMGLALNQDLARRAELLKLGKAAAKKDYTKFEDLDLGRLQELADEGFIDLGGSQNESPSGVDFLQFLVAWPEARAHGYAIGPPRTDYRVTLEGLACDLAPVAPERREPLRRAFIELCRAANELETEGDSLSSWWT